MDAALHRGAPGHRVDLRGVHLLSGGGRTESDAALHLELQVKQIADAIRNSWPTAPSVIDTVERNIAIAESDLRLGIQIFDRKGRVLLKRGSLARQDLGLSGKLNGSAGSESRTRRTSEASTPIW